MRPGNSVVLGARDDSDVAQVGKLRPIVNRPPRISVIAEQADCQSAAGCQPAPQKSTRRRNQRGLTLIELIVAFTILALLSTMALPLARYKIRRDRERELRVALEEIRHAIDKYKDLADAQKLGPQKLDSDNYPESLEQLVDGVKLAGEVDKKIHFLRRIPKDPMTNSYDWGKRSTRDDPKSQSFGGQNLFDVYTKSTEKARDGTPYSEW